ncbi:MAG: PQQ-like beta-propeller repeat protein, partial [Rhodopirellula sp.]|nr:PQQ-like beta-propeller repeat protein [Rhodopirellula sp.]
MWHRRPFFVSLADLFFVVAVFTMSVVSCGQETSSSAYEVSADAGSVHVEAGWPFVRGATFDGHSAETGVADEWPAEGPPVLWTREIGQGYSAFVAASTDSSGGRRVFTQTQTLGGQTVLCLDGDTGETIWSYRYDWPFDAAGVYPGPRATPTLFNDHIYFAGPSGLIGCLTAETGDLVWSRNVVEEFGGKGSEFGYSCSPTVVDRLVVVPVGGEDASLVALRPSDGGLIWKKGNAPASYTPAFPIERDGQRLIVGYMQNSLAIVDERSGERLWKLELSNGYDEHSAWPIYKEPYLWISAPFRSGSQLLEIPGRNSTETELRRVWKNRLLSNDVTSSVLVDGHLYGFDLFEAQSKVHRPSRGKFRCVEFETGTEKWSVGTGRPIREDAENAPSDEPFVGQCGIVVADGKLIMLNEIGELILARVNSERYEELARTMVLGGELVWTPPTLSDGRVYVRNHSRAVCLFVGQPEDLQVDQPVLTVSDVPQSEYYDLAATLLSIEPEYAFDLPSNKWLWSWYLVSILLLGGASILAVVMRLAVRQSRKPAVGRFTFLASSFLAGAFGTTLLSGWTGDFVFTWPVCVFVAFDGVARKLKWKRDAQAARNENLKEWGRLIAFLTVAMVYFLLCRRLSLVTEWVFLVGFPVALPFSRIAARFDERPGAKAVIISLMSTLIGFTAYYAA